MQRDTKTELLDFAENAARRRGFDGFSYADLAEAAGIRKASIHYHFTTKAVLSAALMDRYHAAVKQGCADIDAAHPRAADRLTALIAFYRDALGGGETLCLCVSFTISRESLADDVKDKISKFRAMMVGWIKTVFELAARDGTIAGAQSPILEAHATLSMLEGAHLAAHSATEIAAFDHATKLLVARCGAATAE
ncbi:MAG: TetR/AcrR family transcriptional regulator [Sulfitobacter sp.]